MSSISAGRRNALRGTTSERDDMADADAVHATSRGVRPDSDSGFSHTCDGCDAAAPCGSCGGNIRVDHPAYQAFQWALLGMRPGEDPFWAAAMVAQTLSDAPARTSDPSWAALDSMIRRVQSVQVVSAQGANAKGMLLSAWRDDPVFREIAASDPDIAFKSIGAEGVFASAMMMQADACCPTLDNYSWAEVHPPKPGVSLAPQLGLPDDELVEGSLISASFSVKAHFEEGEGEDGVSCKCSCCEFKAEIIKNELVLECSDPRIKNPKNPTDGMEDCVWYFYHPTRKAPDGKRFKWTQPGPRSGPPAPHFAGGKAYYGPVCPGNRSPIPSGAGPGPAGTPPKDHPADKAFEGAGNCDPEFKDTPSVFIPKNCKFHWSFSLKGTVTSTCPGGGGAGPRYQLFDVDGSTDDTGAATITYPPDVPAK